MSSRMSSAATDQSPLSWVAMKPCRSRCSSSLSSTRSSGVLRQPVLQRRPRALQRAVGRLHRQVEDLRGLGRRPLEHVAQHEHRALARRQELDHGHVRQLDRLARDDDRVRLLLGRRDLVEQPVRVGLQPRDLALRRRAPLLRPQRVQAHVGRDLVQPRAQPFTAGEARARLPRPQERVLQRVLGLVEGARASGSSGRAARAGAGRARR